MQQSTFSSKSNVCEGKTIRIIAEESESPGILRLCQKAKIYKGLQSPKYKEKLKNARLCNNDKSFLYLPRHSSFTINHTFANLGNTGHNMAQTLVITTVSTTKAHGGRARVAGEIGHIP